MNTQRLFGLALCSALALGCGNSTPNNSIDMAVAMDLATKPADLATTPPDMTTPGDMATVFNGCTGAMFSDQSGNTGVRTVTFGGGLGNAYSPKCILIAAGQQVTFSGAFATHPIRPGVGATATAGSPNNPITPTNTGVTLAITFPTAGIYPYNCMVHDGGGMNGAVQVK